MDNVIFSYTDEMAIADGVLVDISVFGLTCNGILLDRATSAVWHSFLDTQNEEDYDTLEENPMGSPFVSYVESLVSTAQDKEGGGFLLTLDGDDEIRRKWTCRTMWLVKNERNKYTLMFPEDY